MSEGHVLREDGGSITVTPSALAQIVQQAAETVEGARVRRPRRGLELEVDGRLARVELELAARFGVALPDLARTVQERVADALGTMVELEVEAVDVSIEELEEA
jgi:uncharacterized alkaline shock family protein YloU